MLASPDSYCTLPSYINKSILDVNNNCEQKIETDIAWKKNGNWHNSALGRNTKWNEEKKRDFWMESYNSYLYLSKRCQPLRNIIYCSYIEICDSCFHTESKRVTETTFPCMLWNHALQPNCIHSIKLTW